MPLNAFRSFIDALPFKGRSSENAISMMRLNLTLLGSNYLRSPPPSRVLVPGYDVAHFAKDRLAFHRLLFVYYADRMRALIENAIHIFTKDAPERSQRIPIASKAEFCDKWMNERRLSGHRRAA